MKHAAPLLLALILSASTLSGCEDKITADRADRVTQGMTRDQVNTILGDGKDETTEGFSISGSGIGGKNSASTQQIIRYGTSRKAVVVTFRDGKVFEVVKVGL